jgi:hypothetical protein
MDIVRAVFVTLAVLGLLGVALTETDTAASTSTGIGAGAAVTNDGGSPTPPGKR